MIVLSRAARPFLSALLLSALALGGCTDGGADEPQAGSLRVAVTIDPDPPTTGRNMMHIIVKSAAGAPLTGAQLVVDPMMTAHGHGSTETPVVTDEGQGLYMAYPVTFQMPGAWEVTVTATAGADSGSAKISYDVR